MGAFAIIFSIMGIIVPILVIGVVIYIIVIVTRNKDKKTKFKLSAKTLLQVYLYLLSFLTLGVAVIGGTIVIKTSLSYVFGTPFSYTIYKTTSKYDAEPMYEPEATDWWPSTQLNSPGECDKGEPVLFHSQYFCFDSTKRKTDLINGLSLLISMSLLFVLHQYALSKIDKEKLIPWLKKIYTFGSLILYSIVSIIAIPTTIYTLTNYLLFEIESDTYSTPIAPAIAIATTVISVPLWLLFFKKTTLEKEDEFTEQKDIV